jgi:hypothetical protein
MSVKKEKQLWTSHRCFPGCVLEVVCLVRRTENEKVAQIRNILDFFSNFLIEEKQKETRAIIQALVE